MQRLWLDRNRLLVGNPGQVLVQSLQWNAPEIKALAAAEDRRQHPLWIGRGQHENHLRWWLLQRLEQRIESSCGEHVALINHVHLPARLDGCESRAFNKIPNIIDTCVGGGIDLDYIERGTTRNRGAELTIAAGFRCWAVMAETIE